MSYAIMRAIKVKTASDIRGCEIHNDRLKDHSNSNPDIDFDRTKDNYQLGTYKGNYNGRIEQEIRNRYKGTRAIRKDATKCIELLFTSDKAFFDGLTPEQERAYFEDCYNFAVEHFGGKANIIGDRVHKDEETPHMHLDIVPLTTDGRLSAKDFLGGKKELQALQDAFYAEVGQKWGLDRGSRADLDKGEKGQRHKSAKELKEETTRDVERLKKEVADLGSQIALKRAELDKAEKTLKDKEALFRKQENDLKASLLTNETIEQIPYRHPLMNKNDVIISEKDFKILKEGASIARNKLPQLLRSAEILDLAKEQETVILNEARRKANKIEKDAQDKVIDTSKVSLQTQLKRAARFHPEEFDDRGVYRGTEWADQQKQEPTRTRKLHRSGDVIE